jgi:phospholipid/cholesterol/gamma-HCH transport system permease protein
MNAQPIEKMAENVGRPSLRMLEFAGGFFNLNMEVFRQLFKRPFYWRLTGEQIYALGVQSLVLVTITALATGSVMTLQFGYGVARFGGKLYVPNLIVLTILREMGPVFTSLLVAGRIGSGMASEIASMNVTQQIDAIRALGTSPIKRIVIPRFLACLIGLPALTLFADYICLLGGMIVAYLELNIDPSYFITKCMESARMTDFTSGLVKSFVFGWFISLTACWKGLNTTGGTIGVGNSTTWVVVTSSIFIMISDFFLTKFFLTLIYGRT